MAVRECLTTEEIYAQFDSEWVVLHTPVTTDTLEVKGGTLIWHTKDKSEVYPDANELPIPRRTVFVYTGRIPTGTVVVI